MKMIVTSVFFPPFSFKPLWNIIDERWNRQLHIPSHAPGYHLNPKVNYGVDFKADYEVKRGLYDCLQRMIEYVHEISKIEAQLEDFKTRARLIWGRASQWWESYGDEHLELQTFAFCVLSLICSSFGCERNWRAFEMVSFFKISVLKIDHTFQILMEFL
jgi:hypothetical protein